MTAIDEQILTIIDQRLTARASALNGEYERDPSGDPTSFPAFSVEQGDVDADDSEVGTTRYSMDIAVEVFAEGAGGGAIAAELNAIHAAIVGDIMADPPFGGLAEQIKEGRRINATAELAERPRKGFRKQFTIIFPTRRGDPAQQ